jgi:hypothetical protein
MWCVTQHGQQADLLAKSKRKRTAQPEPEPDGGTPAHAAAEAEAAARHEANPRAENRYSEADKAVARHPQTGQFTGGTSAGTDIPPNAQPLTTADLASTTPGGLMTSMLAAHNGRASVQRLDGAPAASAALASALGRNAPSGLAGQPPVHVAPTGVGAQFRVSPPRSVPGGAVSLPAPGGA